MPVILQMEALECGAASLAMILAYYRRFIPLEQLRVDCGVSRDGSKASNIVKAAQYHGLKAKGYRYSVEKVQKLEKFPVIIHWDINHFVVLDGFKKNKAIINDPASGVVEVSMEDFEKSFTGITLAMEPGENFETYGKKKTAMDFLGKYIEKYKGGLVAVILCGLLSALFGSAIPVFSKIFMDYVLLSSAKEWMDYLVKAMLLVLVALMGIKILMSILLFRARRMMGMQMSSKFIWHTLRLPVEFYQQRSPGDISSRQMDNDAVTDLLFTRLAPVLINVLMAILYFFLLCTLNIGMAMVALIGMLLQAFTMKTMMEKNRIASKNISRDEGKYIGAAMAGVSMIETVKASGAEEGYFRKIVGYLAKYNNSKTNLSTRLLITGFLPEFLTQICNAVILIMGVYYILDGKISIGLLMAFQGFLGQFMEPIGAVLNAGSELQEVSSKLERINDVLDYPVDVEVDFEPSKDGEAVYERLEGKLEFREVEFAYGRLEPSFIKDFNLTVEPGQMIALVGGSGSGKSTIANLITGIYPLRSGAILFDGKEKKDIDRYVFTQSVSIVNQSISIFRDSVRNNLTLWDDSVEEQVIVDACKAAGIYEDIMQRPNGLNFELAEGGHNLSGGQRQRIEIARAFIKKPSLLILDEATSALDPTTEKKVMEAIKEKHITCVIIAHRLSTIRNADQIVMLKQGQIIEVGNHESLLELDGAYAKLVKSE